MRVFEKALLLPVYIEAFFCMHREAVSKQTICQVGLSAQRPAAPRACTGISWHYGHCHISLPNARPDAASCLRACSVFRQVLTRETPSERHSLSPAPLSSPNDTNRNSNRMASPGGRFTSLQKSHGINTDFYVKQKLSISVVQTSLKRQQAFKNLFLKIP